MTALGVLLLSAAAAAGTKEVVLDAAAWKAMPDLPAPVTGHRATVVGNALYVMGGRSRAGASQAAVWRADLAKDGTFGAWKRDRDLPAPLADFGLVSAGGRLLVAGGSVPSRSGERVSDRVWTVAAGAGGLGPWTEGPVLPEPVSATAAAVAGGRVFLVGGLGEGGHRATVVSAELSAGVPGEWSPATPLPVPIAWGAAVGAGRYLVVIGGQSPGEGKTLVMPTVYIAPVSPGGTIATWYLASSKLPGAWLGFGRAQTAAVLHRDALFCFGGQDALWFLLDTGARASFDASRGEVGPWGLAQGPAAMPQLGAAAVWKDRLYLVAGRVKGALAGTVLRGTFIERDREE